MRRIILGLSTVVIAFLFLTGPPARGDEKEGEEQRFAPHELEILEKALRFEAEVVKLVKKLRPASVSIENWRSPGKGKPLVKAGAGSGVIISKKGYILTNQHVVQHATEIWVVLEDHRRLKATLVGNDPYGDVALLKITARRLKHGDPRKARPARLSPGEWVIATGNPFFLAADGEAVVTLGVVSGLGRVLPGQKGLFFYGNAIQHDAKINPGNSGGPLWDSSGHLLGLNGKIATNAAGGGGPSSSGVGYTIPIDQIRNALDDMLAGRPVMHGDQLLGIAVKTYVDAKGTMNGAEVTRVTPGSPAAEAASGGVQVGDILVQVNIRARRHPIRNQTDFIRHVSPLAEDDKITLIVKRRYKRILIANIVLERIDPGKKGRGRGR